MRARRPAWDARRAPVCIGLVTAGVLLLSACSASGATDDPTGAPSAGAAQPSAVASNPPSASAALSPEPSTAPSPQPSDTSSPALDSEHASALLDRLAAKERFVGLPEFQFDDPDVNELGDGKVCDQTVPSSRERLVTGIRGFFSESKPLPAGGAEVQQETTVYRTERAAADALQEILDAKEACDREQESGQVIRGYRRARIPRTVTLDARAVSATMVVQSSGDQFAYRFGCVQRGPVLQCVHTYTITEPVGRRWFNRALTATSRDLSRSGAL